MFQVLHLSEIQIHLGIPYFHLLSVVTLRRRPVLVSSRFCLQRSGGTGSLHGARLALARLTDSKPETFPLHTAVTSES